MGWGGGLGCVVARAQVSIVQTVASVDGAGEPGPDEVHGSLTLACVGGLGRAATLSPSEAFAPHRRGTVAVRDALHGLHRGQVRHLPGPFVTHSSLYFSDGDGWGGGGGLCGLRPVGQRDVWP